MLAPTLGSGAHRWHSLRAPQSRSGEKRHCDVSIVPNRLAAREFRRLQICQRIGRGRRRQVKPGVMGSTAFGGVLGVI
ncbi:MAG: hypothetical protein ACREMY_06595, partial [bacterium]